MSKRTFHDAIKVEKTINDDPLFCQWFVGLVDGEGCFSLAKVRKNGWMARLTIGLREDDSEIINLIKDKFGGTISITKDKRKTHAPAIRWDFHSPFGCQSLVKLFEKWPLRSKKKKDFDIWKKAITIWVNARRKYPLNAYEMTELNNALKHSKAYKGSPPIDYEDVLCLVKE